MAVLWHGLRLTALRVGVILALAALALAAPARADTGDPATYWGGPVSHSMTGVIVDWGPSINSAYTNQTTGDPGLVKYLAASSGSTSDIGGVLAQYMDSTGHNAANHVSYGGQYVISPGDPNTTVQDSDVQNELVSQIGAGHLPTPSGDGLDTVYLVLFPAGDQICLPDGTCSGVDFCAYHGSTTLANGTNVLYAVLPDNTTGGMTQGCGSEATFLQDQTSFTSHEWSEVITDPLVADAPNLAPPLAWYDSNCPTTSAACGEIGDKCNQTDGTEGGWTVQLEWSDLDGACVGGESLYGSPTASFTAPTGAQAGQALGFNGSSSSDPSQNRTSAAYNGSTYSIAPGIASYDWNWGDSSADGSGATATHSYAAAGDYQVSLTVTDDLGFTSTVTKQVSVAGSAPQTPQAATTHATGVGEQTATLNGTINAEGRAVTYQFAYGTSPTSLNQTTSATAGPTGATTTPVSASLTGLASSTTYYYRLQVSAGAQTVDGTTQSFTTDAAPQSGGGPQTPVAGTGAAAAITARSAELAGTLNPGGSGEVSYQFAYGTSPSALDQLTALVAGVSGTSALPVSAPVADLQPGTRYYFRLEAGLAGTTYRGSIQTFTTLVPLPSVLTGSAGEVAARAATLAGSVDPNGFATVYLFEYGRTTAYGQSSPLLSARNAGAAVSVSALLRGLRPDSLYHYRLVATNAGGTVVGADRVFRTARPAPPPPRFSFWLAPGQSLTGAISRHLIVDFDCSRACVARFAVTVALSGISKLAATPLTLARGSARLRSRGRGRARLSFTSGARLMLARNRSAKLVLDGYAVGAGGSLTSPGSHLFRLRRR